MKNMIASSSGTYYYEDTDIDVVIRLDSLIHTDTRVRIFYGDTERQDFESVHGHKPDPGKDWGEEYDMIGTIGLSTGTKPITLMLNNSRSMGGGAILTDSIVRIIIKRSYGWQEVYIHPNYHSKYDNALVIEADLPEYSHMVVSEDGEIQARFHSEKSARNWLAFMQGNRFSK